MIFYWLENPLLRFQVGTDLRMMIWKAFQKQKIEIPFPQRDLHVRSGLEKMQTPATMDSTTATVESPTIKIENRNEKDQ
jgi:small-conductance mechanosensitive channel